MTKNKKTDRTNDNQDNDNGMRWVLLALAIAFVALLFSCGVMIGEAQIESQPTLCDIYLDEIIVDTTDLLMMAYAAYDDGNTELWEYTYIDIYGYAQYFVGMYQVNSDWVKVSETPNDYRVQSGSIWMLGKDGQLHHVNCAAFMHLIPEDWVLLTREYRDFVKD